MQMKRPIQFIVVLVIAMLSAEPAVAGLFCSMDRAGSSLMCAQMADMGPDCPMHGQTNSETCAPDCCNQAQPSSTVTTAFSSAKPRLAIVSVLDMTAITSPQPHDAGSFVEPPAVLSASPPRHLLLRVFRI